MSISSSTAIFFISLLAIPIIYVVNTVSALHGEVGLFMTGTASLLLVCFLVKLAVKNKGHPTDPLLYVLSICAFGGVVSLIVGLEGDGIVRGFMAEYLIKGEPYLKTAYGTMISYWDGIGHYALILMILSAMSWNQSYREVGLYWAGSIGHSMIVFMIGNVVGKYSLRWSVLLNVPYIFIPFFSGARFLRERPAPQPPSDPTVQGKSILRRPVDLVLVMGLIYAIVLAFFRAFAVLGANNAVFQDYLKNFEPYLEDPVAYPKIQMLVYLFQYVPYYVMAIHGLLYPGCNWMPDWSLLHAGAAAQAQVTHIGASLHHRTPYVLRVPRNTQARGVFWAVNLFLLIFPQLLAYRCVQSDSFFAVKSKTPAKKKEQ